jgi:multiple sugar transport system permease protein/cellobiose transport system permease protein
LNIGYSDRQARALRKYKGKKNNAFYLFVSPYFLIYVSFSLFPIIYTFYISLTKWNGFDAPVFYGLKNYLDLFKDERFYNALGNTLIFMLMIIPIQIALGMVIAFILSSKITPAKNAFRLFNFLPYLTTPVALGIIFGIMFDYQFGIINSIITGLGIARENINFMSRPWPARIMVSFVGIWRYYGYTSILFLAGLTNINPELYEAAEIDGVNSIQKITKISIPLLKPVIIFVVLTTMIGCFQMFEEPFILFTVGSGPQMVGGPEYACLTGMWFLYDTAFGTMMRFGYGSSIAYGMFMFIAILTLFTYRIMKWGERK